MHIYIQGGSKMGPKRLQFITLSSPKASKKKQTSDGKVHIAQLSTKLRFCKYLFENLKSRTHSFLGRWISLWSLV